MDDEVGEWLSAAETRAFVEAAFAAAGVNDDAPSAIVAKAAFGQDTLETAVTDGWVKRLADNSSNARWRASVMRSFWGSYLVRPLSTDWLNGDFATEEVSLGVATSRSISPAKTRVQRLWIRGARFRRQQVEALWPNEPAAVSKGTSDGLFYRQASSIIIERHRGKSEADIGRITGPQLLNELIALNPVQKNGQPYSRLYLRLRSSELRNELRKLKGLELGHHKIVSA